MKGKIWRKSVRRALSAWLALCLMAQLAPLGWKAAAAAPQALTLPAQFVEIGESAALRITDDAGSVIAAGQATYESSDAGIASVDAAGLVTGVALGRAVITATVSGVTLQCEVAVVGENLLTRKGVRFGDFERGVWLSTGSPVAADGAEPEFTEQNKYYWINDIATKNTPDEEFALITRTSHLTGQPTTVAKFTFPENSTGASRRDIKLYPAQHDYVDTEVNFKGRPMANKDKLYEFTGWVKTENTVVLARDLAGYVRYYSNKTDLKNVKNAFLFQNIKENTDQDWTFFCVPSVPLDALGTTRIAADTSLTSTVAAKQGDILASHFSFHEVRYQELRFTPASATTDLTAGDTVATTVAHFSNTGTEISARKNKSGADVPVVVTYESSNPSAATVESDGTITAVADGSAKITATATIGGVQQVGTIDVTVDVPTALSQVTLSLAAETISEGETTTARVAGTMSDGAAADLSGAEIRYESTKPDIATIAEDGTITAHAAGDTDIKVAVTLDGVTKTDEKQLTVTEKPVPVTLDTVTLTLAQTTATVGEITAAGVTGKMTNGAAADLSGAEIQYESTKPDVATIAEDGTITALAAGDTDIKVTVTLGGVTKTDEKQLTVRAPLPASRAYVELDFKKGFATNDDVCGITYPDTAGVWEFFGHTEGWDTHPVNAGTGAVKYLLRIHAGYGIQMQSRGHGQWVALRFYVPAAGRYRASLEHAVAAAGGLGDVYLFPAGTTEIEGNFDRATKLGSVDFYHTSAKEIAGQKTELSEVEIPESGDYILVFYAQKKTSGSTMNLYPGVFRLDGTSGAAVASSAEIAISKTLLAVGEQGASTVAVTDTAGAAVDIADAPVEYTSSAPEIIETDAAGKITAKAEGTAYVTAYVTIDGKRLKSQPQRVVVSGTRLALSGRRIVCDFGLGVKLYPLNDMRSLGYQDTANTWAFDGYDASIVPVSAAKPGQYIRNGQACGVQMQTKRIGQWVSMRFRVPDAGRYTVTLTYGGMNKGGIGSVYLAPVETPQAERMDEKYLLGDVDYYSATTVAGRECALRAVNVETPGEYVVTYRVKAAGAERGFQMYPAKLTLSGINEIGTVTVQAERADLAVGEQTQLSARAEMTDETPVDMAAADVSYFSENTDVASVDPGGVVYAKAEGSARIGVRVARDGSSRVGYITIRVTDESEPLAITIEAPEQVFIGDTATLTAFAEMASGNRIAIPADAVTYALSACAPDGAAELSGAGLTAKAEGSATISAQAEFKGKTLAAQPISVSLIAGSQKAKPTIYTYEKRENIAENVSKYPWARLEADAAADNAEFYVRNMDTLWNMVVAEGLPRSGTVGAPNDPDAQICRYCKTDLKANYKPPIWLHDVYNSPWKIQCPACRRKFPSNDFESYYELGLDEHGVFHSDVAKSRNQALVDAGEDGYLKNILYPEMNTEEEPNWGVDDGFGYLPGRTYPNGVVERHSYIALYIRMAAWTNIESAITSLKDAYLYTGEEKYGRAGAIILDRVADVYPDLSLYQYKDDYYNTHGLSGEGKVHGRITDCTLARNLASAYDAFYPIYDDAQVIDYLSDKAQEYQLDNPKDTAAKIRRNAEDGILRAIFEGCKSADIYGNFGMQQGALATAAVALDSMPDTRNMIDWIMQPGKYSRRKCTGGNVLNQLMDVISRDGTGNEGSPEYNTVWLTNLLEAAEALHGYDAYSKYDLYQNPKFAKMFAAFVPLTMCTSYTSQIGDASATAKLKLNLPPETAMIGYSRLGDPELAKLCYILNGNSVEGLHKAITEKDPESVQDEIREILRRENNVVKIESNLLAGYGFAAVRDGARYSSPVAYTGNNTQRDVSMYFGLGIKHGHRDALNLGLDAFGLNLAPDLGYPEVANLSPNRIQWISPTLSHNTVVVNQRSQTPATVPGEPLHFDDSDAVKVIDIDCSHVYDVTDVYRRTAVMVAVDDENSYSVDFFRILGGDDHIYSFHAQSNEIAETEGLTLTAQTDASGKFVGTYAGADVPWGPDPWSDHSQNPETGYVTLQYPDGFTWLDHVRRDKAPARQFAIDFKIRDFRGQTLPQNANVHLRMTMMNDFDLTELALAKGYPPSKADNAMIPSLEYVLARRTGSNLDTLFTTVYEPYQEERYLAGMELVSIDAVEGSMARTDAARAIKVTRADGQVDYIVYATNNQVKYRVDNRFEFRGVIGVLSYRGETVVSGYLEDGDLLGEYTARAAYTGNVLRFTEALQMQNEITITPNGTIDPAELAGRYVYIENDGTENAVYKIKQATAQNGAITLDIGDVTTIRKYLANQGDQSTYQYNISSGQKVYIPLAHTFGGAPVFAALEPKTAEVGAELKFTVSAESPNGQALRYSAKTLPRGAQFDADTQTFTWIPDSAQVGEHYAAFAVTDGERQTVERVTITVYNKTTGGTGGTTPVNPSNPDKPTDPDDPKPPVTKPEEDETTFAASEDEVNTSNKLGSITFPDGTFAGEGQGKLKITKDGKEFNVKVTTDLDMNKTTSKVSLNYTPDASMTDENCIILRDSEGNIIPNARYENGKIVFYTEQFGDFTVDYNAKSFTDLGNHKWASDAIIRLAARGIINGITPTTYGPAKNITRADFTTLIVRTFGFEGDVATFADVAPSAYYAESVGIAKTLGIVGGVNATDFAPTAEISRQDMMVIIARALEAAGYELSAENAPEFEDLDQVADYAKDAVAKLTAAGIIAGKNGRIDPTGKATRAEVAVILDRILFMEW